ncbi:MAG: hypothetical protein R3279_13450, partial [Putridiphycobacter sp.]|nr:hypothetical protein [Putridiphycobacter sp.]
GIVNSNLSYPAEKHKISPIHNIVQLEKEYLRDRSIRTIVKFLNGFKKLVRPKIVCTSCHGFGKKGGDVCPDCSGQGFTINSDVTDEIILPIDPTNPDQKLPDANNLATYIGLDTETWDQYTGELDYLEKVMYTTLWGTHYSNQSGGEKETATARLLDVQPVISKLNKYGDVAEWVEWTLTEWLINHKIPTKNKDEKVAIVQYGRSYIIEPTDVLLKKYIEARKEDTNVTVLDRLLVEYITSKYKNDVELLREELLKKEIEPYIHYTVEQVNDIYGVEQAQKKMAFNDWWETILDTPAIKKTKEQLTIDYDNYFETIKKVENGNSSSNEEAV